MKTLWPSLLWLHRLKESLLPRPFERMAIQGEEGIVGAEVGVFEGDHAAVMLKNADIRLLYLVDPYVAYNDYGQKRLKAALATAQKQLAPFAGRCAWCYQSSVEAAKLLPHDLDFVYLDGNHDYPSVKADLAAWWPKIKRGGVLGGHDFFNASWPNRDGVVKAVAEFVTKHDLNLKVEMSDWWIRKGAGHG